MRDLVASKQILSLSDLSQFIAHPDERIAVAVLAHVRTEAEFVAWALYDRAVAEADAAAEAWTPLLDAAACKLEEVATRPLERSPSGNLVPAKRAGALAAWAREASGAQLENALAAYRSEAARSAIVRSALHLTEQTVRRWVQQMPLAALAENQQIVRTPQLAAHLARSACDEIRRAGTGEDYASEVLRRMLDLGWVMEVDIRRDLLDSVSRTGLIDHEEDAEDVFNQCYPAASVMAHSSVAMTDEEWMDVAREVPLRATSEVAQFALRADAPGFVLEEFVARLERHPSYMYDHALMENLAVHPRFACDPALRARYMARANFHARLQLVPVLTPAEYWSHASALTDRQESTITAWLEAATPEQRASATPDVLMPFLQHKKSEVRLRAQALVPVRSEPQEGVLPSGPARASRRTT